MRHSPLYSLLCGLMIGGILVVCAVGPARSENRHHLSHYHEERLKQLGEIAFPPLIEGSAQFFVPGQGFLYNSNTRERGTKNCKRQVGHDDGRWIIFEDCEEGEIE